MSEPFDKRTARTWARIDLEQAARNLAALRVLAGDADLLAVVKADAYGHGAIRVAREGVRAGVAHFGVASVAEALELRQGGIAQEIHLLSPFLPDEAGDIVRADLTPMLSSRAQWDALAAAARDAPFPARAFLKVDTGMGRSGCLPDEARALWQAAGRTPWARLTGIATHFSSADEADPAPTEAQSAVFADFLRSLGPLPRSDDGRGGRGLWLSWANSPAALRFPRPFPLPPGIGGTLLRAGLILYGIEPYPQAFADVPGLGPLLTWQARVTLVRDLPAGATIGYGRSYTLTRPSRIATLAAGYADGLPRRLSNRGHVLLRGQRLPLVGRVSMDQCQIDVTDAPAAVPGDIATLIGRDGPQSQSVLDIADRVGAIPHEVPCALGPRVARLYTPRSA